jgi:hypothetical protein
VFAGIKLKNNTNMNGYDLSRQWFDFCFENPEKISPNHTALYFFAIEHCNRLGWKEKFGLPTEMAKDAIGIKNYRTFSNAFNDLIDWGFIKIIEKSKNQYSANIIALVKNAKATTKALSKATQKHSQKQGESIVGINKPNNQDNIDNNCSDVAKDEREKIINLLEEKKKSLYNKIAEYANKYPKEMLREFYEYWTELNDKGNKMRYEDQKYFEISRRLVTWHKNLKDDPKKIIQTVSVKN